MLVHLLGQIVARFLVGKIEPVLVDQHLLQFEPLFPRLFRYVLKYPLAELTRIRRKIEPFGFASESARARPGSCRTSWLAASEIASPTPSIAMPSARAAATSEAAFSRDEA